MPVAVDPVTPAQIVSNSEINTIIADARPAAEQFTAVPSDHLATPAAASSAPQTHPAPSEDPIIVADPTASPSAADDPSILWSTGMDAESAGNFAKAVEAYERIESLPSYLWPSHLEVRLELACKELKGDVH